MFLSLGCTWFYSRCDMTRDLFVHYFRPSRLTILSHIGPYILSTVRNVDMQRGTNEVDFMGEGIFVRF